MPHVSIIIVNWNGFEDTKECIESLLKINYENYSIIVVDNGSKGDDAEKLRKLFRNKITVLETGKNLGFSGGVNVGIKYALKTYNPDYILLLNNDTVVDKNFLYILVKALESRKEYGIATSKIYYYDEPEKIWSAGGKLITFLIHYLIGEGKEDTEEYNKPYVVDFVTGACMLIKREVIEKIGLLDTDYFLGWEDIDYCFRARKAGYKCIYVPYSVIWHKVSASYKRQKISYLQVYFGFRNRMIMRAKNLRLKEFLLYVILELYLMKWIHVSYYAIIYKDIKRIIYLIKGSKQGIQESITQIKKKILEYR